MAHPDAYSFHDPGAHAAAVGAFYDPRSHSHSHHPHPHTLPLPHPHYSRDGHGRIKVEAPGSPRLLPHPHSHPHSHQHPHPHPAFDLYGRPTLDVDVGVGAYDSASSAGPGPTSAQGAGGYGDISPVSAPPSATSALPFLSNSTWPSGPYSGPGAGASAGLAGGPGTATGPGGVPLPSITTLEESQRASDEYDEDEDGQGAHGLDVYGAATKKQEREIRRRSSKACDQCRKSKCKCERAPGARAGDACKNCVVLNTACTFLGPSRKRGPPKGYIDAIEARLHQAEALIGILLSADDERARTLLEDLAVEDTLAKEIIERVDASPYGRKGRRKPGGAPPRKHPPRPPTTTSSAQNLSSTAHLQGPEPIAKPPLVSTHPTNEWQDVVTSRLNARAVSRGTASSVAPPRGRPEASGSSSHGPSPVQTHAPHLDFSPTRSASPARQRRRLSPPEHPHHHPLAYPSSEGEAAGDEDEDGSGSDLADAVGQLSLNEDEQVRWHGKISGLHLLDSEERVDRRNEGGLWRFPKARIWPPLPGALPGRTSNHTSPSVSPAEVNTSTSASRLPPRAVQEELMNLYFAYVHPALPIVYKRLFLEDFNKGMIGMSAAIDSPVLEPQVPGAIQRTGSPISNSYGTVRRIPLIQLYAMFAVAARYASGTASSPFPPTGDAMWPAGDEYFAEAKAILDKEYASPRPCIVKALLLLGYREIGIGAMAQAWLYIGMAVRMAQDLGMHKSADEWARFGGKVFGHEDLQMRKRIWYACVVMDKYVSTYIGRPLAIFEGDFDVGFPAEEDVDEMDEWQPYGSQPLPDVEAPSNHVDRYPPVAGRLISCFNASARLSMITAKMVQSIYGIKPTPGRYPKALLLEAELDKWYRELPVHLRFEPVPGPAARRPPPPHVLTLHMHYWTAVLLLHRPFIRHLARTVAGQEEPAKEATGIAKKEHDTCARAANHITSIASTYAETFSVHRCPVYLSYYLFTAGIQHVTTLTTFPDDPQARLGLLKLMGALKQINVIWPSAGRAWELLNGSKVHSVGFPAGEFSRGDATRLKRPADARDSYDASTSATRPVFGTDSLRGAYLPSAADPSFAVQGQAQLSAQDRWPSGAEPGTGADEYEGGLSTSVLPQQYSTGLVHSSHASQPHQAQSRNPQYWNDYSTLGQLGLAYGVAEGTSADAYMQGQYDIFGGESA